MVAVHFVFKRLLFKYYSSNPTAGEKHAKFSRNSEFNWLFNRLLPASMSKMASNITALALNAIIGGPTLLCPRFTYWRGFGAIPPYGPAFLPVAIRLTFW